MKLVKKDGQNFELNIHAETVDFKGETYDIIIHDGDVGRAGHIASNNFLVKYDHIDLLIEQFKGRKGNVDKYQGFEGFMLIRNGKKMTVLTGWSSTEAFQAWVDSEAFQNSHVKKEARIKAEGSAHLEKMPVRENYTVEV